MANQIGMTIEQLGSLALSRSPNSSAYKGMTARQVGEMLVTKNKAYSGGKTFDFQQPKKYADYKKSFASFVFAYYTDHAYRKGGQNGRMDFYSEERNQQT